MTAPTEILAIGEARNNAQLVAHAHILGYITGSVLDLTYGEGKFWTLYRPEVLLANDLDPAKGACHYSATDMPFPDDNFDTVVFDPPYKLAGTRRDHGLSTAGLSMDDRYGTADYMPDGTVKELLEQGTAEACRLARRFVLVKCMDQVNSGRIHWQTDDVTAIAKFCGFRKKDVLFLRRKRAQDPKRTRKGPDGTRVPSPQLHARRNYSSLLVFEREK